MAFKPGVLTSRDKVDQILKSIRSLTKTEVLVGVPDINAGRDPEPGEGGQPLSNAEIGYLMETGVPEKNIPARPFLIPGVREAVEPIGKQMESGARKSLTGDTQAIDATMNKVGLIAQNAVRMKITDGPFAPLAPKTLAKRRAKGRTGEKPLLDTGQLRQSITYVIRPKGR